MGGNIQKKAPKEYQREDGKEKERMVRL